MHPDFLLARMYLAMGYLRLGEDGDAYRHFQLILPLTDNKQLQAISYNALGCIQVKKQNMQKALEYFQLAYQADPASLMEASSKIGNKAISPQRLP
jgi:tetratricopeptide (TPR) repeat protein